MGFDLEFILLFALLGAFVGFMAGLFGVGGGAILVPMLTSIFLMQGVEIDNVVHLALGTSMASIVGTSYASFRAHNATDGVLWRVFRKMALGVILGTFMATFVAAYTNSYYLAIFFALFIVYASFRMMVVNKEESKVMPNATHLFGVGSVIGMVSALVSIGGGSLTVPFLVRHGVQIKKAIGTSAAIGFPLAISGTLGYMINGWEHMDLTNGRIGYVYLPAVFTISLLSFFTAPFGVRLVHRLPTTLLKKLFAILLISLSLKMLYTIFIHT